MTVNLSHSRQPATTTGGKGCMRHYVRPLMELELVLDRTAAAE